MMTLYLPVRLYLFRQINDRHLIVLNFSDFNTASQKGNGGK